MPSSLTVAEIQKLVPYFPKSYIPLLGRYLAGEDVRLNDCDFEEVTAGVSPFTRMVLYGVCQIGRGQTITYKELAQRLGIPSAVRAVASALGRNPLPIIIPCHRVVASQGKLGGYAFGLGLKQILLDFENHSTTLF